MTRKIQMKVYRTDVTVFATLYVVAESEEEARAKFAKESGAGIEAMDDGETFCGRTYSAERLAEPKYSPAMSVAEFKPSELDIELMEEDDL